MNKARLSPSLLLAMALIAAGPTKAEYSNSAQDSKTATLSLCGSAVLKAYGIFTVGEGRLYRPNCAEPWVLMSPEPRLMSFRYTREVPRHAFAQSAEHYLSRQNIEIGPAITQFHEAYQDVKEGDLYTLEYQPGEGLELRLNDDSLGRLNDDNLAQAYFAIWLGDQPFDDDLKNALLGLPEDSFW